MCELVVWKSCLRVRLCSRSDLLSLHYSSEADTLKAGFHFIRCGRANESREYANERMRFPL